jgi:hypothetical protein
MYPQAWSITGTAQASHILHQLDERRQDVLAIMVQLEEAASAVAQVLALLGIG